MKGITHRYTFRRWSFDRPEPGYIDPAHVEMQGFYRETYWFGILIKRDCLFKEQIPNYAWIQASCCGGTDWKSDCPPDVWLLCTGKVKA